MVLDVVGSDDPWLQYDWDDDDGMEDGPFDDNPTGRTTFGIFNGPRDFIYIRGTLELNNTNPGYCRQL